MRSFADRLPLMAQGTPEPRSERLLSPLPPFAGEGWVKAFFLISKHVCHRRSISLAKKKTLSNPSRESGKG